MAQNVAEIVIRAKDEATATINTLGSRLSGLMNNQFVQGTLAIAGFNLGLDAARIAISSVVGEASKLENAIADFTTLTGSVDDARKMVDQLRQLGAQTPFEFLDLSQATKTLLGFGAATKDDLIPTLRMLGDVAGGNADRLYLISLAFGQIKAAGKASMQDINQLIANGVPIIGELAKGFGVSVAEMRKMVEQGKATSDEVTKAFQRMTSEGGLFYKSMERSSQTLSGRFSTFVDETKMMAAAIGTQLMPMLSGLLSASSKAVSAMAALFDSKPVKLWVGLINEAVLGIVYIFERAFSNLSIGFKRYLNDIKDGFNWLIKWGDDWKKYKLKSDADIATSEAEHAKNSLQRDLDYNKRHTDIWNNYKGIKISGNNDINNSTQKTNNDITASHQNSDKTITDSDKKKTADKKKNLEEIQKAEDEFNARSIKDADARLKEIKAGETEYREFMAKRDEDILKDKEKNEELRLETIKDSLKQITWEEELNARIIDEISKNGLDSKEAMGWKFVNQHKKLVGIMAGFEKDKEKSVTDYIKDEIKTRITIFAAGLIAQVMAWGAANALWTLGGSLILAGVASAAIGSAVSEAGLAIDQAFSKPEKSEDQKIREELEQEAKSREYQDKKEAMRKILYPETAKTPTTSTNASGQSVSTMNTQTIRSSESQTIEVVVQLDKQTLGRAIVDLQRQQNAGVL